MKSKKRVLFMTLLTLMMLVLAPSTVSAAVKKVQITSPTTKSTYTMYRGNKNVTRKLKVKVTVTKKSSKKVRYKSSNPSVVSVSSSGKLTARKTGKARITVYSRANSRKKDTITIKVKKKVAVKKITAKLSASKIYPGQTAKMTVSFKPKNASVKTVTYKSANKSIATIDKNGKITAKATGTVKLTATSKDNKKAKVSKTLTVEARPRVSSVTWKADSVTLDEGRTSNLADLVTYAPADAQVNYNYSSADPSVASVSASGLVSGVSKGTTTVTVTASDRNYSGNTYTKTIRVTVRPMSYTQITMTGTLNRTYTDVRVNWNASNFVAQMNNVLKSTSGVAANTTYASMTAMQGNNNIIYSIGTDANKNLKITSNGTDVTEKLSAAGSRTYDSVTVNVTSNKMNTLLTAMSALPDVSTNLTVTATAVYGANTTNVSISGLSFKQGGYSTATINVNGQSAAYRLFVENGAICIKGDVRNSALVQELMATGCFSVAYHQ